MPKRKGNLAGRAKKTEPTSNTLYFYLPDEIPYGVFCQWHPSPIVLPTTSLRFLVISSTATPSPADILSTHGESITFTCAEQLYMFCKALYFYDAHTCMRILAERDPKEQKVLGQRVKGFNEYKWTRVKSRVVRMGSWYKFVQNRGMRDVLLATRESELAEASSRDRVWGIGYGAEEAESYRHAWGENRLGKALMGVRDRLRKSIERDAEGQHTDWEWDGAEEREGDDAIEEEGQEHALEGI